VNIEKSERNDDSPKVVPLNILVVDDGGNIDKMK
jgi:hypothetical protein